MDPRSDVVYYSIQSSLDTTCLLPQSTRSLFFLFAKHFLLSPYFLFSFRFDRSEGHYKVS